MLPRLLPLLALTALLSPTFAEEKPPQLKQDIPYAGNSDPLQTLDLYTPTQAQNAPVVIWIHGGGWQTGDKKSVQQKPQAFTERGFVFASLNYRLLPNVAMGDIIRDVAKAAGWVHAHVAEHGGDPQRLFIMGHSAGAQLAALLCTDERYLQAEGVPLRHVKGCVPVDGDTYDVPLIISAAAEQRKALNQPDPKYGHREKFGTPEQHRDYSAVYHVAAGKDIPPFLLLHVAAHPNTTAQAKRLASVLTEAGLSTKLFGAADTDHNRLNANLGLPADPSSQELFNFVDQVLKK